MKSLGLTLGILMFILFQYVGYVTSYFLFWAVVINVPAVWIMAGVVACLRVLTLTVKSFRRRKSDKKLRCVEPGRAEPHQPRAAAAADLLRPAP